MRLSVPARVAVAWSLIALPLLAQDYLDNVVEHARKEFNIPGIAVAVVKDGQGGRLKGLWRAASRQSGPRYASHHLWNRLQQQDLHFGRAGHAGG